MTKLIHIRDIRLFNNAGMSFPVCCADEELLDVDKARWKCGPVKEATCKKCIKAHAEKYPWAK